mmetsp:Transcript_61822/g.108636  ORF Transcript_61822/g.108636 Transcript_61822/m.108636 type:complete len:354 (-) Transcript_61822:1337-2398(-)
MSRALQHLLHRVRARSSRGCTRAVLLTSGTHHWGIGGPGGLGSILTTLASALLEVLKFITAGHQEKIRPRSEATAELRAGSLQTLATDELFIKNQLDELGARMDGDHGAFEPKWHTGTGEVDHAVAELGLQLVVSQRHVAHTAVHCAEHVLHRHAFHGDGFGLCGGSTLAGLHVRGPLNGSHGVLWQGRGGERCAGKLKERLRLQPLLHLLKLLLATGSKERIGSVGRLVGQALQLMEQVRKAGLVVVDECCRTGRVLPAGRIGFCCFVGGGTVVGHHAHDLHRVHTAPHLTLLEVFRGAVTVVGVVHALTVAQQLVLSVALQIQAQVSTSRVDPHHTDNLSKHARRDLKQGT